MRPRGLALLLVAAACTAPARFTASSVDRNSGALHATVVKADLEKAIARATHAAESRGLALLKRRQRTDGSVVVSFTAEVETRVLRDERGAPTGETHRHESRYWFRFSARTDGTTTLTVLGVPSFDGQVACPPLLNERFAVCEPPDVGARVGDSVADSVWRDWRLDVSGRVEADTITAIFGQL